MINASRFGVLSRLALSVFSSVVLAALAISATLYFLNQKRSYEDTVRRSEEMVQAASLAFSQALAADDDVLLDALVYELQGREQLHIQEAYVINRNGQVLAHSDPDKYDQTYTVPALLKEEQPTRLSEVLHKDKDSYGVISLLQTDGISIGAMLVSFSAQHLAQKLRAEMVWIIGTTVPILLLSGLAVMLYGRGTVTRLKRLQEKAVDIGCGSWGEPLAVTGTDEITDLTLAFNQMQTDLVRLKSKDQESAKTIEGLNVELRGQLTKVEQLREQLVEENATLRQELHTAGGTGEIIGVNGGLREVMNQVRQVASLPVTVLITGESGTGKELLTKFLHENSPRSKDPLITVNCAALPITLIESELFGHEKGAFTGAVSQKKGKFELAHGGTLFLDEIGELPLEAQGKLLRSLQEKEVYRVGGGQRLEVDVRVIAATNRNLNEEVKQGRFREDLYYRLQVVELHCPPLRDRLQDLPALAQHFVESGSRALGKTVVGISPAALALFSGHKWPGNIRELENIIARAIALATTQVLGPEDFPALQLKTPALVTNVQGADGPPFEAVLKACSLSADDLGENAWEKVMRACEQVCLKGAMEQSRNQKEAAALLGLTPTKLHRLIKKHELKA